MLGATNTSDPEIKLFTTSLWLLVSPKAAAEVVMASSIFSIFHAIIAKRALRYLRYVINSYACNYSKLIGHIHIPFCATERVQQWPASSCWRCNTPSAGRSGPRD